MGLINTIVKGRSSTGWQRPDNWPARPETVNANEIYYLVKVNNYGNNRVGSTVADDYTVDFGDGTITNYSSGATFKHNIDYTQLSTYLDETETDKVCWVKITAQAGNNLKHHYTEFKDSDGYTYNQGVLEVLVGEMSSNTSAYAFNFANLSICEAIKLYAPYVAGNFLSNLFSGNYRLQSLEGSVTSPLYNTNNFAYCYMLKNLDDFELIIAGGTAQGMCQYSGFEILNLSECQPSNCRSLVLGCVQLHTLYIKYMQFPYQMATQSRNFKNLILGDGDGSEGNNYYQCFYNCNFDATPALNLINSVNNNDKFKNHTNLKKTNLSNISANIGFRNCNLDHDAIYEIFDEQLLTVAATIDLRGNPDIANLPAPTIAIATAKGWTVQIS